MKTQLADAVIEELLPDAGADAAWIAEGARDAGELHAAVKALLLDAQARGVSVEPTQAMRALAALDEPLGALASQIVGAHAA